MPAQTRRRTQDAPATETAAPVTDTASLESNAEAAALVEGDGSAGLAAYESALGSWLGGELYGAVSKELTLEKMAGHAESGLNSVLKALGGQLSNVGDADEAAVDAFAKALADKYDHLAADWVSKHGGGLQQALAGWVDANPYAIAGVGLLAAAGAVLANASIPELSQKFGLTEGLTASVSAKLGSLRAVALEKIKARLEYQSGPLLAAIQVEGGQDQAVSGDLSARYGTDAQHVRGTVKVNEGGIEAWGVHGLTPITETTGIGGSVTGSGSTVNAVKADVTHKNGTLSLGTGVTWQPTDGHLVLRGNVSEMFGQTRVNAAGSVDRDGLATASLGATYTGDDRTLRGSADYNRDAGTTGLDLSWDERLGDDWTTRVRQQVDHGPNGMAYETTGLAAYEASEGLKFFGGASYRHDHLGGRMIPEVGAQIDDVPISIRYDTETKGVSIGVSLSF